MLTASSHDSIPHDVWRNAQIAYIQARDRGLSVYQLGALIDELWTALPDDERIARTRAEDLRDRLFALGNLTWTGDERGRTISISGEADTDPHIRAQIIAAAQLRAARQPLGVRVEEVAMTSVEARKLLRRLARLFENALRDTVTEHLEWADDQRGKTESRWELRRQATALAAQLQADRLPPERMLVELKRALGSAAEDVRGQQRDALVGDVVRWAIGAYAGSGERGAGSG